MHGLTRAIALLALLAAVALQPARAAEGGFASARAFASFTDPSRPVKASMGFAGSPDRRLDVAVWYPVTTPGLTDPAPGGPWPLLIFSHGTFGRADQFAQMLADLAQHGYVVVAPDYPLTSRAAWTRVRGPDISDVGEQVKDVRFLIDRLLADPRFAPMIDRNRIAVGGHSLGAVTSYFDVFGVQTRDPRIKAAVLLGAGDPVQAAMSQNMGLFGTAHAAVPLPVLFLSAEHDVFARMMGRPYAAYARVEAPKYEVMVRGGVHVWFHDGGDRHPEGKNPDCLFFERMAPGMKVPGCEGPVALADPERQHAIARASIRAFLDGHLKGDAAALRRLKQIGRTYREAQIRFEENFSRPRAAR